jgi:hypothetical protein
VAEIYRALFIKNGHIMKVSFFQSTFSTSPKVSKDVSFFLDRIRDGASKTLVGEIRAANEPEKQKVLKQKLPAVCFNGYFSNRSKTGLKKSSGLAILDFDDTKDIDSANILKAELVKDKHIFAAWISPRYGVKALYRIVEIESDQEFKKVIEQVFEKYPNADKSGSDISRLCLESYDPEIYINLNSEVFLPEARILPHEIDIIGQVTNIPLTDQDQVANRLIHWFQKKYDARQRNTSLFKLCSAFNDFGLDKSIAEMYCIRYAQKDFDSPEIKKIIDSAYKKTSQFGTQRFEDKDRVRRLTNMVMGGKKRSHIKQEFKDVSDDALDSEIEIIKSNIQVEKFWDFDKDGRPIINAYKFKLYCESLNYFKHYPNGQNKGFIFIHKDENFIDNAHEFKIKDIVMGNLLANDEIDVFNVVAENTKLFLPSYLSMIETAEVDIEKDGKDFAWIYFKNSAIKVFQERIEVFEYSELDKHIWRDQVVDRDFTDADHHESMFRTFVWLISGEDVERYNTMKSIIGYLLHSYKTSANNKAIILNDETISEHPNGGSGKGLLTNAIAKMKKVSTIDGKNFDFNKSFPYQTVPTDCQVLAFDDVKKNFNFESLFSLITEGITIEYKNQGATKLPVSESPKVLISTNYTLKAEGGSFKRRMFEVELSSYFGAHHSPRDEFDCMLFDDWDVVEWARFDHYMINCLQYFLENGLVEYEHKNLGIRKLINNTSREFVQWMDEKEFSNKERIYYKEFMERFVSDYTDFKKFLSQRMFNTWLKTYFDFKNIDIISGAANGVRYYELNNNDLKHIDDAESNIETDTPF